MSDWDVAADRLTQWRRDPVAMVREEFRVEPDAWQVDALRAFADPAQQRIAMQACAGPGKSAGLAWMGWNFLACYAQLGEHPVGAVTSITGDNLKKNLWKELAKWRDRSPYLLRNFEMTADRIFCRAHPKTWFLDAYSWPKTADAEEAGRTLSGLHGRFILYLLDESGDIPPAVGKACEQGLSTCEWGKIALAGNPTSHDGLLYAVVTHQAHLWTVIRITGDPDDPKRSPRINLDGAREQIRLHGRDDFWVMAYILGKFPPGSINALLSPDEVAAAMARRLEPEQYQYSQRRIGIDIAREGDDSTVLFPRQGLRAFAPVEMRGQRGPAVAARLATAKQRWKSELEMIDDTGGWAGSVIDQCDLAGITLYRVNFSGKAMDPRFFNLRSEMHFNAAEWVKQGGQLPQHGRLAQEAVAPRYWFEKGKFRVEEKDQIKARIGHSPDFWDGLLTTFAIPDLPTDEGEAGVIAQIRTMVESGGHTGRSADWDPFGDE